ncbi:transcriptional repressor, predicted [Enterocytozoon bieneusi H348]|nr:transcriptional repressor, predicted [Enterocytozoon bieneusi H348]|eukprot:XP_002649540.1 transcriptional repressor, predicted [Enterocytozoon bieneusi H348]
MANNKFYSYEALLENLKNTYEARKMQYNDTQHLYNNLDKTIQDHLFAIEDETISSTLNKKDVWFNFDEFMNDLSNVDCHMEYNDHAIGAMSSAERKHVCTKPGCNKSYTSSHGLKYHIAHGHSKEKENAYKPFSCPVANCGKTYRNSNGLKYHMSKIHKHP